MHCGNKVFFFTRFNSLYLSRNIVVVFEWLDPARPRRKNGNLLLSFAKSLAMGIPLVHLLVGIDEPLLYVWLFPIIIFHFIQLLTGAFLIRIFR